MQGAAHVEAGVWTSKRKVFINAASRGTVSAVLTSSLLLAGV
jgi:hypothetical protein